MAKRKVAGPAAASDEKYPELRAAYKRLESEKEKLQAKSAPLRKRRDALRDKLSKDEVELRELNQKIAKIERPRMGEIDNQLAGLARAMGGRSLSEGG